ncbi:alpha-N-acetylglucosaminidase C-terminal domain-containing protein, partial [Nonomuraea fuscirosea]
PTPSPSRSRTARPRCCTPHVSAATAAPSYDARGVRIAPDQFKGVITAAPSYAWIPDGPAELRADAARVLWYRPEVLARAWERLIEVAEHDRDLPAGPLGHDLAEVGVAYMARVADRCHLDAVERSIELGAAAGPELDRFLRVFDDLDRMLACRPEYTFQHWESKALAHAADAAERELLADNARRMITVWGTSDSPLLDDYAGRHWSGLVGGYYRDRWALWATGLDQALHRDPGRALSGRDAPEAELRERLRERAELFLREGPPPAPRDLGDLATESRRLFTAYAGQAGPLDRPADHDR